MKRPPGDFQKKKLLVFLKKSVLKTIEKINRMGELQEKYHKPPFSFKEIHIGNLIRQLVTEKEIDISRIIKFIKITKEEIDKLYDAKSMDTALLLRWSKLLEYDLFRIYSHHLILYSPPASMKLADVSKVKKTELPQFRKNVYTIEIISYMLNLIHSKEKTIAEIIEEYNIPKTTIYRWQKKYNKNK